MRPNLSQFVLICVLIAIPIVQWAVQRKVQQPQPQLVESAQAPVPPVPPQQWLPEPKSASEWAASAEKTANEITRLAGIGRLNDAAELAGYALALPRHPTKNNPYGVGHATLALDRMIDALAAFELWDEAIRFCMQPNAIDVGNAMVESKRLRLVGIAFANKRQLKFRSRILLAKLSEVRKQLNWRQGIDEHHNDICDPVDLIEIDYSGNEAAREHIADSIAIVTALQEQRRDAKGAAAAIVASDASPLFKARMLAKSGSNEHVRELLSEFAGSTRFPLAEHLIRAELSGPEFDTGDLRELAGNLLLESPLYDRVHDVLGDDVQLASAEASAPAKPAFLRGLVSEFPRSHVAPDFDLVGVDKQSQRLSDRRGQPTLVVFYLGRGCLHCSRQLKNLAPAVEDFHNAGIDILGVSTDDVAGLTESFRSYRGRIPFPLVSDGNLATFSAYRLRPEDAEQPLHGTFLVDADGHVVWSDTGEEPFMDMEFLLKESRRLLKRHPDITAR